MDPKPTRNSPQTLSTSSKRSRTTTFWRNTINQVAQHVSRVGREGKCDPLRSAPADGPRTNLSRDTDVCCVCLQSNFQFILRLLNTNVDGKQKVVYALTKIKGVGRRYSNLVCKKADVDLNKRAGELTCTITRRGPEGPPEWSQSKIANAIRTAEELERIVTIIQNPTQYKIPGCTSNPPPEFKVHPGLWTHARA